MGALVGCIAVAAVVYWPLVLGFALFAMLKAAPWTFWKQFLYWLAVQTLLFLVLGALSMVLTSGSMPPLLAFLQKRPGLVGPSMWFGTLVLLVVWVIPPNKVFRAFRNR